VTLVLIDVSVIVVVPSMAVIVEVASLKVDGGQALLEGGCSLAYSHLSEGLDYGNKDVSIQGSIVLLSQAEGTAFPVGHLLSFAQLCSQDFFSDTGKAYLLGLYAHSGVESLGVNEVLDQLVEIHPAEVLSKHF